MPDAADVNAVGGRPGGRTWWLLNDPQDNPRPMKSSACRGLKPSLDAVGNALVEYGPVDGLIGAILTVNRVQHRCTTVYWWSVHVMIGFSQGAVTIALFLAHLKLSNLTNRYPKFIILVSWSLVLQRCIYFLHRFIFFLLIHLYVSLRLAQWRHTKRSNLCPNTNQHCNRCAFTTHVWWAWFFGEDLSQWIALCRLAEILPMSILVLRTFE